MPVLRPSARQLRFRRTNPTMPRFVDDLMEFGPVIPEIARRMREHRETVRYWYKTLLRRGFTIQASVNFEKLGLRRVVAIVRFSPEYDSYGEPILTAMSELCYLQSYVRTLPTRHYVVHGAVPEEFVAGWTEFMGGLKDKGFLASVEFSTYDWVRDVPMKTEFYNFDEGIWEFEWSKAKVYPEVIRGPSPREKFDRKDLEIIKHLQIDANKSLADIQKQIGENYKTLSHHYRNHVLQRRFLKGYRVDWMGTRLGYKDHSEHRRRKYQRIDLIVKDIREDERAELMGLSNSLPYLWWEGSGSSYYAQFAFPTENITEAMEFLAVAIAPFGERAKWFMVDQARSMAFTISPGLFEPETGSWKFDRTDLQGKFEQLLMRIKKAKTPKSD